MLDGKTVLQHHEVSEEINYHEVKYVSILTVISFQVVNLIFDFDSIGILSLFCFTNTVIKIISRFLDIL